MNEETLICGWCGNHRKGKLGDGVACSCGGRSWLICTLGCMEDEAAPSPAPEQERIENELGEWGHPSRRSEKG